jgi:Chaperone of endosialidase
MARYNTVLPTTSISSNTSVTVPGAGQFTEFTGSTSAVTIPDPTVYYGQTQTFFNNTSGSITLTTPSGSFLGKGASGSSTQTIVAGAAITLASDGASYVIIAANGGVVSASTLTASSTVTLSPAALVTISPTGGLTIAPTSVAGTIDNTTIGVTTSAAGNFSSIGATSRGTGLFTTLGANSTVTLSPSNANVTISPSGTGVVTMAPATLGTMDNMTVGGTTRAAGYFTTLQSSGINTFSNTTQGSSATSGQGALFGGGVGIAGTLYTVGLVETSSLAFKENINPITGALDAVLKLTGVTYDRKDNKKHEAGLIAEEVYKIAPDLVALDEKGKPYGIHYTKISAYLIESIKALQAEIDQLKGKKKTKGSK